MFKRLCACFLSFALGIILCGCAQKAEDDTCPAAAPYKTVSLTESGELSVTRKDMGNIPMGEDGTWTVFVYMSGADLEGESGKASEDMDEMLAASTGKNVRFIVQTGGSEDWKNDYASAEKIGRFEFSEGKVTKKAELPLSSMGDAATLRNFLKWGVENYPAEKMGIIFWGHGEGSLGGVCRDDLFDKDHLTLDEINGAFAEVSADMTDKFEFVGFDACYMGTIEAADVLAAYARYMISSEELEPANGWNYTALGDLLGEEPDADWSKIAATLCDTFSEDSSGSKYSDLVTLSVVDLSEIDDVIVKFNDYARDIYEKLTDKDNLKEFEMYLEGAEHFGAYSSLGGYSNCADLADAVSAGRGFSDKADAVLEAIEGAVVYKRNGKEHRNACGLTICHEFSPNGIAELRTFAKTSVSPYFLAITDRKLRGASPAFDISGYDCGEIISLWLSDSNNAENGLYGYWSAEPNPERYKNGSGKSSLVKLSEDITIEANGAYSVSIEPDALQNVAEVGIRVFSSQPDYKYYGLGTMPCADADWESGVFSDEFGGLWFMLPNREPLAITLRETENGRNVYGAAVQYHEKETTVIFSHGGGDDTDIDGFWRADENGETAYSALRGGDALSAFYAVYTRSNDVFKTESGAEHVFDGEPEILYGALPDGDYYFMVVIKDIWGDEVQSETVDISVPFN